MKCVQLTIDGTELGTEVPPGGIVWHERAAQLQFLELNLTNHHIGRNWSTYW
jgi:hypothetical protein